MKNLISILALSLTLGACAKDEKTVYETASAPSYSIASIPQGCIAKLDQTGEVQIDAHVFPSTSLLAASVYDCGVREGRTCTYWLNVDANGVRTEDSRCQ